MECEPLPGPSAQGAVEVDPKIWKSYLRICRINDDQIKAAETQLKLLGTSGQEDAPSKGQMCREYEQGSSPKSDLESDNSDVVSGRPTVRTVPNNLRRKGFIARPRERMLIAQDPKILKAEVRVIKLVGLEHDARYKLQLELAKANANGSVKRGQRGTRTRGRIRSDSVANNDTDSDPDWGSEPPPKSSQQKKSSGRPRSSTTHRPGISGRRRKVQVSYLPGEPELPDNNGFDRGLTAKRVVAVLENPRNPDLYSYVVEFADPRPEEPDHVSQEVVPRSTMHTHSPTKSALSTAFYLTRLKWAGKISRSDIDGLQHGLLRERERLQWLQEVDASAARAEHGQQQRQEENMESQAMDINNLDNNSLIDENVPMPSATVIQEQEGIEEFEDCQSNLSTDAEREAPVPVEMPTGEVGVCEFDEFYDCEVEGAESP